MRPLRLPHSDSNTVQRATNVGWEPRNSAAYRKFTSVLSGNPGSPYGGQDFCDGAKIKIYASNDGGCTDTKLTCTTKFGDDFDTTALLTRIDASKHSPEIDHIVEATDGGASSLANGRVLSQGNNTGKSGIHPNRPKRASGEQMLTAFTKTSFQEYTTTAPLKPTPFSWKASDGAKVYPSVSSVLNPGDEVSNAHIHDLEVARGAGTSIKLPISVNKTEIDGYHKMGNKIEPDQSNVGRYVKIY